MFEGIGLYTVIGTLSTIGIGVATPMDCYAGLAAADLTDTFELGQPVGSLGCQYDWNNTRLFAEHLSSPSRRDDWPGINHAGIKQLFVNNDTLALYGGMSIAAPSKQLNGSNILSQVGGEVGKGPVRLYGEYILSIDKPEEGMLAGGLRFVF